MKVIVIWSGGEDCAAGAGAAETMAVRRARAESVNVFIVDFFACFWWRCG